MGFVFGLRQGVFVVVALQNWDSVPVNYCYIHRNLISSLLYRDSRGNQYVRTVVAVTTTHDLLILVGNRVSPFSHEKYSKNASRGGRHLGQFGGNQ